MNLLFVYLFNIFAAWPNIEVQLEVVDLVGNAFYVDGGGHLVELLLEFRKVFRDRLKNVS